MATYTIESLNMASLDELACTYSALILADDDVPITVSTVPRVYKLDSYTFRSGLTKYRVGHAVRIYRNTILAQPHYGHSFIGPHGRIQI